MQLNPYEIDELMSEITNLNRLLSDDVTSQVNRSWQKLNTKIQQLGVKCSQTDNINNLRATINQIPTDTVYAMQRIRNEIVSGESRRA